MAPVTCRQGMMYALQDKGDGLRRDVACVVHFFFEDKKIGFIDCANLFDEYLIAKHFPSVDIQELMENVTILRPKDLNDLKSFLFTRLESLVLRFGLEVLIIPDFDTLFLQKDMSPEMKLLAQEMIAKLKSLTKWYRLVTVLGVQNEEKFHTTFGALDVLTA